MSTTTPSAIAFTDRTPEAEPYRPAPERILAGDPVQRAWNHHSSPDGRFHTGVWEGQPGRWAVQFTETEFCHLLSGRIVVTDADGLARTFQAGDSLVMPAGFHGTWEVLETCRKLYAVYE